MTLESCAKFCDGSKYFGTEYGRECYCGNVLQQGSVKAPNQDDCNFPCAGDGSEYCGAGNRLELYQFGTSNSSLLASSSSSASQASSTSSTTPLGANATSGSPSSAGVSSTSQASPSAISGASSVASVASVASSSLVSSAVPSSASSSSVASTSTLSTSSAAPTATGPVVSNGNANFTYYSCVSEPSNGRLLDNQPLNSVNMTIELCLKTCYNYQWAGVEYGQECWCGNTLNLNGDGGAGSTPGKNVSDSECSFLCPGNQTEYCGAGVRLSLYKHKDLTKRMSVPLF